MRVKRGGAGGGGGGREEPKHEQEEKRYRQVEKWEEEEDAGLKASDGEKREVLVVSISSLPRLDFVEGGGRWRGSRSRRASNRRVGGL